MQDKINSSPLAALTQIKLLRDSRSQSTCLKFWCCCCADDEDNIVESISKQGEASLKLLINDLKGLIIPSKEFRKYDTNRNTVAQVVTLQRAKTKTILEQAISSTNIAENPKYPELPDDVISELSKVLRSLADDTSEQLQNEEDESADSLCDFN